MSVAKVSYLMVERTQISRTSEKICNKIPVIKTATTNCDLTDVAKLMILDIKCTVISGEPDIKKLV